MRNYLLVTLFVAFALANKCSEGECCDLTTNTLKPKGTVCSTNACTMPVMCTGDNPYCPMGGTPRTNGTACPEGLCFNGKCKMATPCVNDCCDDNKKARIDGFPCAGGQCISGKCKALPECIGSCCDGLNKPKSDGTACPEGNCMQGMCTNLNKRCTVGHCCDVHKKVLRPKGFKCTNNPCATKVDCLGTSEFCPKPTHFLVDGTPCPAGICMAGVCIDKPFNATEIAEQKRKEHDQSVAAQQGGKTIIAGNIAIHKHRVSLPVCKTGACCDTKQQEVFEMGANCTAKECFVGTCDGKHSGCEYTVAPPGTVCEGGYCFDGACIKNCIGGCCEDDETTPKDDGSTCADGFCFRGTCIKTCNGECCEPLKLFADTREQEYRNQRLGLAPNYGKFMQAKVDGSPCLNNDGFCVKGECTRFTVPAYRPKDSDRPEVIPHEKDVLLFKKSFMERFVKNFFMAAAKVENDNMDGEDLEYLQKLIADEKAKAKADRALRLNVSATAQAELLKSAYSTSGDWVSKLFNKNVLFYVIVGVVVIAVVACIIKIVSSRSSKSKEPQYETVKKNAEDYGF